MFKNKKDLVCTSLLGGRKNSKLISLCHCHNKKFQEKMTILKNAISLVNSCFLVTRETRSLHITFIFFLLWFLYVKIERKTPVPDSLFEWSYRLEVYNFWIKDSSTGVFLWLLHKFLEHVFHATPANGSLWNHAWKHENYALHKLFLSTNKMAF